LVELAIEWIEVEDVVLRGELDASGKEICPSTTLKLILAA
jgi:hypothetical protein